MLLKDSKVNIGLHKAQDHWNWQVASKNANKIETKG